MTRFSYTDRDVRGREAELRPLIERYLTNYKGDFEFLRDMRDRMEQGVPLHVPHIRGVLNCMRMDPNVTYLPVPERPTMPDFVQPRYDTIQRRPRKIKVTWKKDYGVATTKNAHAIHILWKERSTIHWVKPQWEIEPRLVWYCNSDIGRFGRNVRLLTNAEVVSLVIVRNFNRCRMCHDLYVDRNGKRIEDPRG